MGVRKGAIGKVNGYPREAGQRKGNDWVLRGERTSSQGMTNPFLIGGGGGVNRPLAHTGPQGG